MRPPCGAYSCNRIHSHRRCYWTLPSRAVLTQGYRHHCSHGTRCHQPLCPELLLEWDHSLAPGRLAWLPYPRPPVPHPWGLGPNNTSHLARVLLQPDSVVICPHGHPAEERGTESHGSRGGRWTGRQSWRALRRPLPNPRIVHSGWERLRARRGRAQGLAGASGQN